MPNSKECLRLSSKSPEVLVHLRDYEMDADISVERTPSLGKLVNPF